MTENVKIHKKYFFMTEKEANRIESFCMDAKSNNLINIQTVLEMKWKKFYLKLSIICMHMSMFIPIFSHFQTDINEFI